MVCHRLCETEGGIGIFGRVQGQSHVVFRAVMLVTKVCLLFLKMRGVRKENSQQIDGCRRSINRTAESLLDHARKITRMIDVRMRQDDCVQRSRIDRRLLPVPQPEFLHALKKTTIDEDSLPRRFEQELRASDSFSRAKERQPHPTRIPRMTKFGSGTSNFPIVHYHYRPMDSSAVTNLAAELHRRAVEKFGTVRGETLRTDLLQLARELEALNSYEIEFEDEP